MEGLLPPDVEAKLRAMAPYKAESKARIKKVRKRKTRRKSKKIRHSKSARRQRRIEKRHEERRKITTQCTQCQMSFPRPVRGHCGVNAICPICRNKNKIEKKNEKVIRGEIGIIYFCQFHESIKIGFTVDLLQRLDAFSTTLSYDPVVIGIIPGTISMEQAIHKKLADFNIRREHFKIHPIVLGYMNKMVVYSKKHFSVGMNRIDWERYKQEDTLEDNLSIFEKRAKFGSGN